MLDVDPRELDRTLEELYGHLGDGLVAADVLDLTTGISLVSFNSNPATSVTFALLTDHIQQMLEHIMFPELNRFFLLDLYGDHCAVVARSGEDMLMTVLIDNSKTTLGMVLAVAIPTAVSNLDLARR